MYTYMYMHIYMCIDISPECPDTSGHVNGEMICYLLWNSTDETSLQDIVGSWLGGTRDPTSVQCVCV